MEDIAGDGGDLGPDLLGDGIAGAEIEEGLLAHGRAVALGLDETHGVGGLASFGMGLGGAQED